MNDNFNYNKSNNNKKLFVIIGLIAIICIGIFIYFKFIHNKTENVDISNQNVIENNISNSNNTNNEIENTNTNININSNENLNYDKNSSFLMPIEDVFTITGRGTVVTGRIERGTIKLNDQVQIIGLNDEVKTTVITGIEMFRENLDSATAGDNVGLVLKDIERDEVERGQVLSKPNTISAKTKFSAEVYILTKEEGGRHTPFFDGYRPQFYFRTTDITGEIKLPNGTEMVNPGDTVNINVELTSPIAMEVGTEFSIREGGRTVGSGKVTNIY